MNELQTITFNVENRVATITLNLPATMNAISQKMRGELLEAITAIENDNNIRVAVIAAAGKGFSSGTDLSEGLAGYNTIEEQIIAEYKPILDGIDQSSKLYISAINGACAGVGSSLALVCDLSVMGESAFVYLPFAGIGLVPDGGACYHLINAMGYKRAMELFVESGRLKADACLQYGLVNKVVPDSELHEATKTWAEKLATGAPLSHRLGKSAFKYAQRESFADTVALEAKYQVTTSFSKDSQAAVEAFFAKKTPVFTGE